MNEPVNWQKVGAIAGMIAVVIALGAWLVPDLPKTWKRVIAIVVVIAVVIALGAWLVPDLRDVLVAWLFETPTVTPISSPTHTPVISTATPTNTPSPPTATATSTPACTMAPMHGFDSIWENTSVIRERLGCPLEAARKTLPVEESFQNGRMFWRKDADRIYVIYADGTWQEYENPWREGDPQTSCQASPPASYHQPVRGFGKI
jgi:hypothetical protein